MKGGKASGLRGVVWGPDRWAGRGRGTAHLSGSRALRLMGCGELEWLLLTLSHLVPSSESSQQHLKGHESPSEPDHPGQGQWRDAGGMGVLLTFFTRAASLILALG